MRLPEIPSGGPGDFHDSEVLALLVDLQSAEITAIVATPERPFRAGVWQITFSGVLRFEYETRGSGAQQPCPFEAYEIYFEQDSAEVARWQERLGVLGLSKEEAQEVKHVVLANSFHCGWGRNEAVYGLTIICRSVTVHPAPPEYQGYRSIDTSIPAGED